MGLFSSLDLVTIPTNLGLAVLATVLAALLSRIFYLQYIHPLSNFPGPWYATSFSLVGALISIQKKEPRFLTYLVRKYGADRPIRISPTTLMFPHPSSLKDIYRDPKCNTKSRSYGTGALGPPHLFSTLDGEEHKALRKALSNAPWTIGPLKQAWESRFDDEIKLFIKKMREHSAAKREICLSDKVAEFSADIMSMISFTDAFGCVQNQRDQRDILKNWRKGLVFFGLAARFRFFREHILRLPIIGLWLMPSTSDDSGMGWLMCEADRQVSEREDRNRAKVFEGKPDFMQHCLDARFSNGSPLTPVQKRAHVTQLIQAGADTTGTALGCTLRFLLLNQASLRRAREEIDAAERSGHLSTPIQFEETRQHLPYFTACIKESLRLNPPAPNLLGRTVPPGGRIISGHFIPGGTDVLCNSYAVQRNKAMYGEDAEVFNPDRWLESEKRAFELDAAQLTFGTGPRVCLGKDVAIMELYKLLPEMIRRFDVNLKNPGKYVVVGGVAYNVDFLCTLTARPDI